MEVTADLWHVDAMNVERKKFRPIEDFLGDEDDAIADARADAEIAASRGVPHEEVVAWLKKWGTPDEVPAPAEWFE